MAKVKIVFKDIVQVDEDSVALLFHADNISNPAQVVETIKKAKEYWEGSLTFWQVVGIIIKIWTG